MSGQLRVNNKIDEGRAAVDEEVQPLKRLHWQCLIDMRRILSDATFLEGQHCAGGKKEKRNRRTTAGSEEKLM